MSVSENLARRVPAGEIVKPWLMLGPFYEDLSDRVQGLTLFERPGATVGTAAMAEIVDEARAILASRPREGQESAFRGEARRWSLVRGPEQYLSWGRYNISNHLGAAFLTTLLSPEMPGTRQWRLAIGLPSRGLIAVNGQIVFDTGAHPVAPVEGIFEYRFESALAAGDNVITVGLFRVARMAQVGFRLELTDVDVDVRVPPAEGITQEARLHVEQELAGIRLARDVFYPEHEFALRLGLSPRAEAPLTVHLLSEAGERLREVRPAVDVLPPITASGAREKAERCQEQPGEAGLVTLCPGTDLKDGLYHIVCSWQTAGGSPLTAATYDVHKVTPVEAPQGYDRLEERKRMVLEHYAGEEHHESRPDIWCEVARYALGRYEEVDEDVVRDTCEFIAARKDCADFVIQGVLRLMCWEQEQRRLSAGIDAMMKDTVLGFKYWVDEPGDTVMYMGSENHRLLFHVAEWMAGQLFPTEEFTNSRMRGLYHATKGRTYIAEWLRQRGRFGFDEWHSNSYYPICIAPLANVYDFAIYEDAKLRQMAGAVLDYMFYNLAADSLNGVLGTTHGRSYGIYVKYPDFEGTSATCWLLYGTGSLVTGTSGMSPVTMATSHYQVPQILADIATDREAVVESKVRQGILPGSVHHANFCVYRTPDYMMSGLQDHRKGEFESSTHVAQVTLRNKVLIFWSCPHTTGEGSGLRPDYWSGHTILPRVIQHRNIMSITWRLSWRAWMSHCFFEQEHFDEVRLDGKWAFARVGQGCAGIYSQHGMEVGAEGQYAGRELICTAPENTWLVECGREADWGSFEAFVSALKTAEIGEQDGVVTYQSPSAGRFVTGWDVAPTIDGAPIQLHGYPLVDSLWASSAFGSGELAIHHGDQLYEIWFNQ